MIYIKKVLIIITLFLIILPNIAEARIIVPGIGQGWQHVFPIIRVQIKGYYTGENYYTGDFDFNNPVDRIRHIFNPAIIDNIKEDKLQLNISVLNKNDIINTYIKNTYLIYFLFSQLVDSNGNTYTTNALDSVVSHSIFETERNMDNCWKIPDICENWGGVLNIEQFPVSVELETDVFWMCQSPGQVPYDSQCMFWFHIPIIMYPIITGKINRTESAISNPNIGAWEIVSGGYDFVKPTVKSEGDLLQGKKIIFSLKTDTDVWRDVMLTHPNQAQSSPVWDYLPEPGLHQKNLKLYFAPPEILVPGGTYERRPKELESYDFDVTISNWRNLDYSISLSPAPYTKTKEGEGIHFTAPHNMLRVNFVVPVTFYVFNKTRNDMFDETGYKTFVDGSLSTEIDRGNFYFNFPRGIYEVGAKLGASNLNWEKLYTPNTTVYVDPVKLTLTPNPTIPNSKVKATINSLYNSKTAFVRTIINDDTSSYKINKCYCNIVNYQCECNFTTPSTVGNYDYYAFVDVEDAFRGQENDVYVDWSKEEFYAYRDSSILTINERCSDTDSGSINVQGTCFDGKNYNDICIKDIGSNCQYCGCPTGSTCNTSNFSQCYKTAADCRLFGCSGFWCTCNSDGTCSQFPCSANSGIVHIDANSCPSNDERLFEHNCVGPLTCGQSLVNCAEHISFCSNGKCASRSCSDGTVYGQCSSTKPKYCDNGNLIDKCSQCGCPSGQLCNTTSNSCYILIETTCFDDTVYSQCSSTKPLYCNNGNIINNCTFCGCSSSQTCDATSEACYSSQTCLDGTQYNQCSSDKPRYCDNGNLINKCTVCGCNSGQTCNTTTNACSITTQVSLQRGWNMFSLPTNTVMSDADLKNRCGTTNSLWHYNTETRRYESASTLEPGKGYWIKLDSACNLIIEGDIVTEMPNLNTGWNQIGGLSSSTNFNSIKRNCNVLAGPWKYNPSTARYESSSTIDPGYGYWVRVSSNCRFNPL